MKIVIDDVIRTRVADSGPGWRTVETEVAQEVFQKAKRIIEFLQEKLRGQPLYSRLFVSVKFNLSCVDLQEGRGSNNPDIEFSFAINLEPWQSKEKKFYIIWRKASEKFLRVFDLGDGYALEIESTGVYDVSKALRLVLKNATTIAADDFVKKAKGVEELTTGL